MELQSLEELVGGCLGPLGLRVETRMVDRDLAASVTDPATRGSTFLGVITDHRTERFSLQLDGYDLEDFAVRPEDQVLLVTSFCKVIAAYLRGEGTHSTARLFGFLGKTRDTYSIEVDDQLFSAVRKEA